MNDTFMKEKPVLPQGNHRPVTAARKPCTPSLTPLRRINSCFSKMSSYRIMEKAAAVPLVEMIIQVYIPEFEHLEENIMKRHEGIPGNKKRNHDFVPGAWTSVSFCRGKWNAKVEG